MERKYKIMILAAVILEIAIYAFRTKYDLLLEGVSLRWIQILLLMGIVVLWTIFRVNNFRDSDWAGWHKILRILFSVFVCVFLEFMILAHGTLLYDNEHISRLILSEGETSKQFIAKEYDMTLGSAGFIYEKKGNFLLKKVDNMRYGAELGVHPVYASQYRAEYSEETGILTLWYNSSRDSNTPKDENLPAAATEDTITEKWDTVVFGVVGK